MQQLQIVSALFTLKLIDSNLSEVNGQEIDQLLVVFDISSSVFDDLLKVSNFRLLPRLALEERFQSGLSLGKLLLLNLVASLLALGFRELLDDSLSAGDSLLKTFQIQKFSLKPIVRLLEGVLE